MTALNLSRRTMLSGIAASLFLPPTAPTQTATQQEETSMQPCFSFADQEFTATLEDNLTARNLIALLPLYSTGKVVPFNTLGGYGAGTALEELHGIAING